MSESESFNIENITETYPNSFKSDKFSIVLSNFPSVENFQDFRYFTNYVKTITIPELSMNLINTYFQGAIVRHPEAPVINRDLSQLQLNFRLSEDMKNYFLILDWARQLRYGDLRNENVSFDNPIPEQLINKYCIKSLDVNMLDNHKRIIATLSFRDCFVTMISSLSLEFGNSDEILFSVNMSYSAMEYKTFTIDG